MPLVKHVSTKWASGMVERGIPRCTSKRDYEHWLEAARVARPGPNGFCSDCTKVYQREMVKAERCEYPNRVIREVEDEDEAL